MAGALSVASRPVRTSDLTKPVMPGLVPGIHVLKARRHKDVDGRDKPGHDETDELEIWHLGKLTY
jgi:hypothetical protein